MAIIDHDALFARQVRLLFEGEGYEVEWFDRESQALPEIRSRTFDLIVVDATGGADVCRRLRREARHPDVPIVAATTDADTHADSLTAGADESVLKTLSMRELVARASAVIRRASHGSRETAVYSTPSLEIFPDSMRIVRSGQEIYLSKGEADVLALLIRHAPASLSVELIRAELSTPSASLSRSAIEARVKSLRQKIGSDRILNRIGYGYSFAAAREESGSAMNR